MARKKSVDPDAPNCMVSGCTGKAAWKGICSKCYAGAKQMIEQELTTWVELQTLGLAEGPTIVKEFAKLKQLRLFDVADSPVGYTEPVELPVDIKLQQVLEKSNSVRTKENNKVIGFFEVEDIGLLNPTVLANILGIPVEEVKEKLTKEAFNRVTGRTTQGVG